MDVRAKNEAFRIPKLHSGAAIRDLDMSPSAPCIFTYIYIYKDRQFVIYIYIGAVVRDLDMSPSRPKIVASAGGDGVLRQTDLRKPSEVVFI